jgi:hypothetical protein
MKDLRITGDTSAPLIGARRGVIPFAILLAVVLATIVLVLPGCASDKLFPVQEEPTEENNFIRCTVSGGRGGSYEATGDNASWGLLSFPDGDVLTGFNLIMKDLKHDVSVSSGFFELDLLSKAEQECDASSSLDFNDSKQDNWEDRFASLLRLNVYDGPDGLDSKGYLTLTTVEKLPDGYLRLAGTFHFKASNLPDSMPEAAILDVWANPDRVPACNPDLLGTTDLEVHGTFDVTQKTYFDWKP